MVKHSYLYVLLQLYLFKCSLSDSLSCVRVSGGIPVAMVTMNRLSVEDPGDDSPLLPEAVKAATPSALFHRFPITKPDSWDFFLRRYLHRCRALNVNVCWSRSVMSLSLLRSQNLTLGAVLLFGCYSAVLIPAYFPLKSVVSPSDNQHQNQVQMHIKI